MARQIGPLPTIDRRVFLKNALAASAMVAVGPGTAAVAGHEGRGIEWKRAPCRLCGVGCGLLIGVEGGRAVAVKGDPDSPVSAGLACVKGYYAPQILYGRDRITRALVRRDGGALSAATLPAAYDIIASRMRETIKTHGPDSVALYGSAQWSVDDAYVAARFFRGAIGSISVDTSARLHTASASSGLLTTFGHAQTPGSYDDIDHADVFVLWNVNLAESDPVLFSRILERRRTSPAVRIIDLATLTTRTSYAADRSLLYVPCTELAIANAVCHEIVSRNLANRAFVDRHVAFKRARPDDGNAARESLPNEVASDVDWKSYRQFLDEYAPDRVQRLSGLALDDIRWLASLYGDPTRAVVSLWGSQVNRQERGTWLNNALHNIHLLVGKTCTPGNASVPVAGQPGGTALLDDVFAHRGLPTDSASQRRVAHAWGVNVNALDKRAARPALSIFNAIERGQIRFLWIQATNPMVSLPNLARYRKALSGGNCFVVVSEAYPGPTTDAADVVLPAAMWIEREGAYVNGERRIEHLASLVRPPGDAMSDATHMIEVARRLSYAPRFPWASARATSDVWTELRADRSEAGSALPDYDSLRAEPGQLYPAPGGRETRWRYNAAYDPAADARHGPFDFYGHDDHRAWIWLRPYRPPAESPSRDFPFWFTTGRVVEHWGTGTMTRRVPTLHRAVPHASVEINPDDARMLGIAEGDRVRLRSRRGTVELEAHLAHRIQPPRGVLFAPEFDEEAPVNMLTRDDPCPVSGQPGSGACAVHIERVERRS